MPEPPSDEEPFKRVKTVEDLEAFRSSFGGWADFDLDLSF